MPIYVLIVGPNSIFIPSTSLLHLRENCWHTGAATFCAHDNGSKVDVASALAGVQSSEFVYVSRDEYDHLVAVSQRYASLCDNLIRGGVNSDTLLLLSTTQPDATAQTPVSNQSLSSTHRQAQFTSDAQAPRQSLAYDVPNDYSNLTTSQPKQNGYWHESDEEEDDDEDLLGVQTQHHRHVETSADEERPRKRIPSRHGTRTILISNLSDRATHADVTSAIRGGLVIDIYMRYKDRTAAVSFLYEDDCKAFYDHVRRHDLYINQKRVNVSWNERQYNVTEHIARKVALGATRNLVIRRCGASHTENSIREDLDHIHNLVPVKIEFIGGDCYIQTNSVVSATFARTCMMSRLKYKGSRIEFGADQCAQSLDRMPIVKKRNFAEPVVSNTGFASTMANRFQLLTVEDD